MIDIYPAIDLRHGRVVRLEQGDPARQTTFSGNPAAVAARWRDAGATWLHVVNLDGAFGEAGEANRAALAQLVGIGLRVQFGGGLRTMADVDAALAAGVERVVLGTAALENAGLMAEAVAQFGATRLAVAIDARHGRVRTRGWQTATDVTPAALAGTARQAGVRTLIYTDIARDGLLSGVNAIATAALASASRLDVIASGGVSDLGDVERLRAAAAAPGRIAGVIIGRALYDGRIDLAQVLELVKS